MTKFFMSPFWGRGFRPFFFCGAAYSVISLLLWGGFYAGVVTPPDIMLDPVSWHAHEMIYGFCMAIIAGFLLTAVANWTGGAPARQVHLAGLCALWVVGRIALNVDMGLPQPIVIGLALLFIPALAISLSIPLIKSRNKRNFIFLGLLSGLFASDACFLILDQPRSALYVALMMVLTMVSLIGGRIIPAFTVATLRRRGLMVVQTDQNRMDIAALASLISVALCMVFARDTMVLGGVAAMSCGIHAVRMRHYHSLKALSEPLLWILHAGYLWLIVGLGLLALTGFGILDIPSVIHSLTAGCIGSMILGMICRVTLGHTGRDLEVGKVTVIAFILIQVVAILRVLGPVLMPEFKSDFIIVSAVIWAICFGVYLMIYGRMLFLPRPDGLPS